MDLVPTKWVDARSGTKIERVNSPFKKEGVYAVRNSHGEILNKDGKWEHEPLPGSMEREDAFRERCLFSGAGHSESNFANAADALERWIVFG